jgi:hypothetical protein
MHGVKQFAVYIEAVVSSAAHFFSVVCVCALQGDLPQGFSVGSAGFHFNPIEVPTKKALMNITVIALDEPSNEVCN